MNLQNKLLKCTFNIPDINKKMELDVSTAILSLSLLLVVINAQVFIDFLAAVLLSGYLLLRVPYHQILVPLIICAVLIGLIRYSPVQLFFSAIGATLAMLLYAVGPDSRQDLVAILYLLFARTVILKAPSKITASTLVIATVIPIFIPKDYVSEYTLFDVDDSVEFGNGDITVESNGENAIKLTLPDITAEIPSANIIAFPSGNYVGADGYLYNSSGTKISSVRFRGGYTERSTRPSLVDNGDGTYTYGQWTIGPHDMTMRDGSGNVIVSIDTTNTTPVIRNAAMTDNGTSITMEETGKNLKFTVDKDSDETLVEYLTTSTVAKITGHGTSGTLKLNDIIITQGSHERYVFSGTELKIHASSTEATSITDNTTATMSRGNKLMSGGTVAMEIGSRSVLAELSDTGDLTYHIDSGIRQSAGSIEWTNAGGLAYTRPTSTDASSIENISSISTSSSASMSKLIFILDGTYRILYDDASGIFEFEFSSKIKYTLQYDGRVKYQEWTGTTWGTPSAAYGTPYSPSALQAWKYTVGRHYDLPDDLKVKFVGGNSASHNKTAFMLKGSNGLNKTQYSIGKDIGGTTAMWYEIINAKPVINLKFSDDTKASIDADGTFHMGNRRIYPAAPNPLYETFNALYGAERIAFISSNLYGYLSTSVSLDKKELSCLDLGEHLKSCYYQNLFGNAPPTVGPSVPSGINKAVFVKTQSQHRYLPNPLDGTSCSLAENSSSTFSNFELLHLVNTSGNDFFLHGSYSFSGATDPMVDASNVVVSECENIIYIHTTASVALNGHDTSSNFELPVKVYTIQSTSNDIGFLKSFIFQSIHSENCLCVLFTAIDTTATVTLSEVTSNSSALVKHTFTPGSPMYMLICVLVGPSIDLCASSCIAATGYGGATPLVTLSPDSRLYIFNVEYGGNNKFLGSNFNTSSVTEIDDQTTVLEGSATVYDAISIRSHMCYLFKSDTVPTTENGTYLCTLKHLTNKVYISSTFDEANIGVEAVHTNANSIIVGITCVNPGTLFISDSNGPNTANSIIVPNTDATTLIIIFDPATLSAYKYVNVTNGLKENLKTYDNTNHPNVEFTNTNLAGAEVPRPSVPHKFPFSFMRKISSDICMIESTFKIVNTDTRSDTEYAANVATFFSK